MGGSTITIRGVGPGMAPGARDRYRSRMSVAGNLGPAGRATAGNRGDGLHHKIKTHESEGVTLQREMGHYRERQGKDKVKEQN